jgi:hypothetical protein
MVLKLAQQMLKTEEIACSEQRPSSSISEHSSSGTEKKWVYVWCMKMGIACFSEILEGSSSVTRCHNPANYRAFRMPL